MLAPKLAEATHRRQAGESVPEALHPAALLIHGDDQLGRTLGVDFGGQRGELLRTLEIACEENHAADERMTKQLPLVGAQRQGPRRRA